MFGQGGDYLDYAGMDFMPDAGAVSDGEQRYRAAKGGGAKRGGLATDHS